MTAQAQNSGGNLLVKLGVPPELPKRIISWFIPHGLVHHIHTKKRRQAAAASKTVLASQGGTTATAGTTDQVYEQSVKFLTDIGCDQTHVIVGSMPKASLAFCAKEMSERLPAGPLKVLHVGNFIGVSLSCITAQAVRHDPKSVVVSVDPNIRHRNIDNPMDKVVRLLCHLGLQKNSAILTGYSMAKSIANDGFVFDGYDPSKEFENERSLEEQLDKLAVIAPGTFDVALIDGNHNPEYLTQELGVLDSLLRPGGLLILDDVDEAWEGIREVFNTLSADRYRQVGTDGRIGILEKV